MKRRIVQMLLAAVVGLSGGIVAYAGVDAHGVGSLTNGEIRSAFGGTNSEIQGNASELVFALQKETLRTCRDPATGHATGYTQTETTPIVSEPRTNKQGKAISGFELKGVDPKATTTVEGLPKGCDDLGPVEGAEARITIKICFRNFWITIIIDL